MTKEPKPKMTDAEVTKLARDLVTNLVFMSDRCRRPEDLYMVFMSLTLADQKTIKWHKNERVFHLYEYMEKMLPGRSINGYPIFFSHYTINKPDYERVMAEELRLRKALGEPCPEKPATSDSSAMTTPQSHKKSGPRRKRSGSKENGSRRRST